MYIYLREVSFPGLDYCYSGKYLTRGETLRRSEEKSQEYCLRNVLSNPWDEVLETTQGGVKDRGLGDG